MVFREIVQVPYIIEYSLIFAMIARNESRFKKFGNYLGKGVKFVLKIVKDALGGKDRNELSISDE